MRTSAGLSSELDSIPFGSVIAERFASTAAKLAAKAELRTAIVVAKTSARK